MPIIKVDPDALDESSEILTWIGAAIKANDVAYQEAWMAYTSAPSDLPTGVWIRTSAASAAETFTQLAGTATGYAAAMRALDRDRDGQIEDIEANGLLIDAVIAEHALDPWASGSRIRERGAARLEAEAAAERISQLAEDPAAATTEQVTADLLAIEAYLKTWRGGPITAGSNVDGERLAAERLLAGVGPNDIAEAGNFLMRGPGHGFLTEDDLRIPAVASMGHWVNLGLEGDEERAERWVAAIAARDDIHPSIVNGTLTVLGASGPKRTRTVAMAAWNQLQNASEAPDMAGYNQAKNFLSYLYDTQSPLAAITNASAGRHKAFQQQIVNDLLRPRGDWQPTINHLFTGKNDYEVDPAVAAELVRTHFNNPNKLDSFGDPNVQLRSDAQVLLASLPKDLDLDISIAVIDAVGPHLSDIMLALEQETDPDNLHGDAREAMDRLNTLVRAVSHEPEALQRLLTIVELDRQLRVQNELNGPAAQTELRVFNEKYNNLLNALYARSKEAGTSKEDWGMARFVAGVAATGAIAAAGATTVASAGMAVPVILAVGGVGIDGALDAAQRALEGEDYDGRADAVEDQAAITLAALLGQVTDSPQWRSRLNFDDSSGSRIRDLDQLDSTIERALGSGPEAELARQDLRQFRLFQDPEVMDLLENA